MTAPDEALGVVVPPGLAGPVWRHLRAALARHRADGGQLAPGVARLLDELRAASLAHALEPSGHPRPMAPDIVPSSDEWVRTGPELIRTAQLADQLGCTDRHARRMARAAGFTQPRRGYWDSRVASALEAARRKT